MKSTEPRGKTLRRLTSLSGRYMVATLMLIGALLIYVVVLQHYITSVRNEHGNSREAQHLASHETRLLREAVLNIEKNLQVFLGAPSSEQRTAVHTAIDQALLQQQRLAALPWSQRNGVDDDLAVLSHELISLHQRLETLMNTRSDTPQQFPAMRLILEEANPSDQVFITAARLAIAESETDPALSRQQRDQLNALRNDWLLLSARFRMYITNRIGLLIESEAAAQEHDIELIHQQVRQHLKTMQNKKTHSNLALAAAIEEMQQAAVRWYDAYLKIKAIPTDTYRQLDAQFMRGQVAPVFASLWQKLQQLDRILEHSALQDTTDLLTASRNIIGTLWLMALAALTLVVFGFWLFRRYVLQPVEQVTKALRDEAHGKHGLVLPTPATAETQHLIEAFGEMRRLVQDRQLALEHQATHDALTGLPNRVLLQDRLEHGMQQLRRAGYGGLALLIMDLDGFKEINDTLGHAIGDGLLQQLTERLLREVREGDTVARLGGDEFALLLEQVDEAAARHMGQRILRLLEQPFEVAGQSLFVTASIGIALYPIHAQNPLELSRRADVAMYVAKRAKSGIALYDSEQDHHTLQRLAQLSDLRNAINGEQLSLHFQPQIELTRGTFSGVEALLRWQHPQLGFISPENFIPVAEQSGLIRHITYWVLDQALAQCAAWRNRGLPLGTVSVNLSAYNLQDGDLSIEVRRLLKKWGIEPYRLVLEITESAMMAHPARAQSTLEKLNDIGIQLAIDDFGTGFSSLSYLKQLPVDKLKIDKTFIMQMDTDENDVTIVRSTIELAHNLGLDVVAEGVEAADTLALLQQFNCDMAQGYFISRPLTAEAMEEWLRNSPYCANFTAATEPVSTPQPDYPTTH